MRVHKVVITVVLFMMLLVSGCSQSEEDVEIEEETEISGPLMISAAASLNEVLLEIKALFEEEYSIEITYNFGGSGKLAQQIEQGAPVDIFISASEDWMQILLEHDFLKEESLTNVTGNELVLITSSDANFTYTDIAQLDANEIEQFALGHPESVPAGAYAKQALEKAGRWDELSEHFVYTQDVRQVLAYVETGNADIGIVYASDAALSENVKVLATIDVALHDDILYPAAIISHAKNEAAANKYLEFLTSDVAQDIFTKYHFSNE